MPIVVTATGLEVDERAHVESSCTTIGAVYSPSLTQSTTHLIATGPGSEKYRVASSKLKIPIVRPSWIEACLAIYSRVKQPLSVDEIEEVTQIHKIKCLDGQVVCVTGFPLEQRNRIEALAKALGARFNSDLTKECTHLIALAASGKKFEFAVKNGIRVVDMKWIDKCAEVNECLSEKSFPVGVSNDDLAGPIAIKLEPLAASNTTSTAVPRVPAPISIPIPTAVSKPQPQPELLPKPKQMTPIMPRLSTIKKQIDPDSSFTNSPTLLQQATRKSTAPSDSRKSLAPTSRKSLSAGPSQKNPRASMKPSQKRSRKSMISDSFYTASCSRNTNAAGTSTLFEGLIFLIQGFDGQDTEILSDEVQLHDGEIAHTLNGLREALRVRGGGTGVVIVPLGVGPVGDVDGLTVVSECWIERCIEDSSVHAFDGIVLFRGVKYAPPQGTFCVGITGYEGLDREQIRKLVCAMGGSFTESLSRKNTHLIAHSDAGQSMKVVRAREWGVTVVSVDWLFGCAERGVLVWPLPVEEAGDVTVEEIQMDEVEEIREMDGNSRKENVADATRFDVSMRMEDSVVLKCNREDLPSTPVIPNVGRKSITPVIPIASKKQSTPVIPKATSRISKVPSPAEPQVSVPLDTESILPRALTQESHQIDPPNSKPQPVKAEPIKKSVSPPKPMNDSISDACSAPVQSKMKQVMEDFINEDSLPPVAPTATNLKPRTPPRQSMQQPPGKPVFDFGDMLKTANSPSTALHPTTATLVNPPNSSPSTSLAKTFSTSLAKATANVTSKTTLAPLKGVRLCLSQKSIPHRHDAIRLCKNLGAEFLNTYSDSCTHYIQDKSGGGGYEWKRVRDDEAKGRVKVVSFRWLEVCGERGVWVSEAEFPWQMDLGKGLWLGGGAVLDVGSGSGSGTGTSGNGVGSAGKRKSEERNVAKETASVADVKSRLLEKEAEKEKTTAKNDLNHAEYLDVLGQLKAVGAVLNPNQSKRVHVLLPKLFSLTANQSSWTKRAAGLSRGNSDVAAVEPAPVKKTSTSLLPSDILQEHEEDCFTQAPPADLSPMLQDPYGSIVTYDDPQARVEKRRLLEQIQGSKQSSKDGSASKRAKVSPRTATVNSRSTATRYFMITGIPVKQRDEMRKRIVSLGGKVIESDKYWNEKCTHLICHQPSLTEKCCAAIARGRWLLKSDYIERSWAAGKFLDEEEWEWGGGNGHDTDKIAVAANWWRRKLGNYQNGFQDSVAGAYQTWIVLLVIDSGSKTENFERILKSGAAHVTRVHLPQLTGDLIDKNNFTHCITDLADPSSNRLMVQLQREGKIVCGFSYVIEFLKDSVTGRL